MGIASGGGEGCFRGTLEGFLFPVPTVSTLTHGLPSHMVRLGLGNQAPEGAEAAMLRWAVLDGPGSLFLQYP